MKRTSKVSRVLKTSFHTSLGCIVSVKLLTSKSLEGKKKKPTGNYLSGRTQRKASGRDVNCFIVQITLGCTDRTLLNFKLANINSVKTFQLNIFVSYIF